MNTVSKEMTKKETKNLLKQKLSESINYISGKATQIPEIAIILGSGLGAFADTLENPVKFSTETIPYYPESTVPGHAGRWIFGDVNGTRILAMQGRIHAYEGYSIQQIGYPVHLMASLGIKKLIVTTACGGLNPFFRPGDIMIITDHINFAFRNPLTGPPANNLGPRFPDMSEPYDPVLIRIAENTGLKIGLALKRGVFCWIPGPMYETAAEIRMLRKIGVDAVSMSTVPEVIVARQRGMSVLGFAVIVNMGTGLGHGKLSHQEVIQMAQKIVGDFSRLVRNIVNEI